MRHAYPEHRYVNLELPDYRQLAIEDPRSFLKRFEAPVIIDEIQRVPNLLSYIQVYVDEHRSLRGGYILTGSQQLEMRAAVSQSLAGRTAILKLLPLSIAELAETGIVLDRDDLIYRGFMPRLYEEAMNPSSLYRNYYQTYVERDVRQFANIRNLIAFETFIDFWLAGLDRS